LLVADDNAAQLLRDAGHRVVTATDGRLVLERIAADRPDLVVIDAQLRGIEACRAIKRRAEFVPVLLIGANRLEAFRAGADDVLSRPLDAEELCARVAVWLRTRRLVAAPGTSLDDDGGARDRLTGLPDQRAFTQRLDEEFGRADRGRTPLSVMAVDVDGIDAVSGRFGRGAGDRLVAACARALLRACREEDLVARAGGYELVALLPATHFIGCVAVAERIQRELAQTTIVEAGVRLPCAASIGAACFPSQSIETPTDLLRMAHAALSRAKAEGQGRICLYQHQGYLLQPQRPT
jgi:two-component system cell cycle response regulator